MHAEAPGDGPLLAAKPQWARDRAERYQPVTLGRVAHVGQDVLRRPDVDRGPGDPQSTQRVKRVMFESGERPGGKQQVHRDAVRGSVHRAAPIVVWVDAAG